jgi:hypothetical protein
MDIKYRHGHETQSTNVRSDARAGDPHQAVHELQEACHVHGEQLQHTQRAADINNRQHKQRRGRTTTTVTAPQTPASAPRDESRRRTGMRTMYSGAVIKAKMRDHRRM